MLVLSRKRHESIIFRNDAGEMIRLKVTSFGRNSVKLGIEAPQGWLILREELAVRDGSTGHDVPAATDGPFFNPITQESGE